ncbi:uncharacterized protein RJT21DRAFT_131402 [Scheffersomyces amazonensis]|uniref:uncharacterized protein n=1 Tax=Scheffersomyces amazonensis TaxID=1078765 RepID=UPI00315C9B27
MKLLHFVSFFIIGLITYVTASNKVPQVAAIQDTKFEITEYWEDIIYSTLDDEQIKVLEELFHPPVDYLSKRDAVQNTVAEILVMVNQSGVIWNVLDEIAGHPDRIQTLANFTAGIIGSINISNIDFSALYSTASSYNATGLLKEVEKSGLITSLLDGILLDASYRPVLVDLIYRIVISQKNTLLYIIKGVFHKRDLSVSQLTQDEFSDLVKRASDEFSGSITSFIGNLAEQVLGSQIFVNATGDVLDALNDTQFLTYTVKRFIADEAYQNMTALLIHDIMATGAINIQGALASLKNLNVTALVAVAVSQPKVVSAFIGNLLSSGSNLSPEITSSLGKYAGAVKQIILGLESKGLFAQLNTYIFSSSYSPPSATATPTTTSVGNSTNVNKAAEVSTTLASSFIGSSTGSGSPTTSSSSGLAVATNNYNVPVIKALFYIQSLIFGGAFLMI